MNSHTIHSRPLARALAAAALFLITIPSFAGKKPDPAKPASQYAAFDTHPDDKVTIAVDPCTDQKNCDFFRLPYVRHSLMPVRVIVTNDSDKPLDLTNVRMQFISGERDRLPAADYDEINRRLFSMKDAKGSKIPLIGLAIHKAPVDKKILEDDKDFGFQSTTVAPHSTQAGYLFYDVKDFDDPNRSPLRDAELYVKMINVQGGKELFAFSIPFNKWLNANSKSSSK